MQGKAESILFVSLLCELKNLRCGPLNRAQQPATAKHCTQNCSFGCFAKLLSIKAAGNKLLTV